MEEQAKPRLDDLPQDTQPLAEQESEEASGGIQLAQPVPQMGLTTQKVNPYQSVRLPDENVQSVIHG